jgi:MFS family permease
MRRPGIEPGATAAGQRDPVPGPPSPAPGPRHRAVRSLANRNFRIFLAGQVVSQTGNWLQQTAEIWLILLLTGSGTAVGLATTLRFGPLLLFGVQAGLLTDRLDRRRLLLFTQSVYTLMAASLGVLLFFTTPNVLVVYAIILVQGFVGAIDNPLRRSFVRDLVADEDLPNAVSLNSTIHTVARAIGPAVAGLLIVAAGVAWCFTLNALSYGVVLVSILLLDQRRFRASSRVPPAPGQLREGFRYAWDNHRIRRVLLTITVLGLTILNWNVILPLYATQVFGGDASLYGLLVALLGLGAFGGAIIVAPFTTIAGVHFRISAGLMAVAFMVVAVAPVLPVAVAGLVFAGAAATMFQILAQARLQLEADDTMSGRVLALYSVALVGTRPIGALITGALLDTFGPRVAFGVFAVIVGLMTAVLQARRAPRPVSPPAA